MPSLNPNLPLFGYGIAATIYLILAIIVVANWRGRLRGGFLAVTASATALWGAGLAYSSVSLDVTPFQIVLLEFGHDAAWLIFLSVLLSGAIGSRTQWPMRYGGALVAVGLLVASIVLEIRANRLGSSGGASSILVMGSLVTALCALVSLEQIYRNSRESERKGLKYFCVGVGGIFVYNVFLYSNAILIGHISALLWDARGYVVAMCAPLIAIGVRRSHVWSTRIFVSRQVVFYTTTLVAAGVYLMVVGMAGYYIQQVGGNWALIAQILFICAAALALLVMLFSELMRARLKVFISKHFFENKYDYREEWLRLIGTLTADQGGLPLRKRAIKAVAQIVDAPLGRIWLRSASDDVYSCAAGWNIQEGSTDIASSSSLVRFLQESGWVVDLDEFNTDPSRYSRLEKQDLNNLIDDAAYIVPLFNESALLGFVVLARPAAKITLNYEDRDLLKTAGQQIASYLAQENSTELLAESRQFDAFNRLTAYIMHDLKNLISQQSLVVQNARKHKDKPEFIDDAVATIDSGVERMRRVIEQLQQTTSQRPVEKVEVGKIVWLAASRCADRQPEPQANVGDEQVWVRSEHDRLLMALIHTIRNAQDATPADGKVSVEIESSGDECRVHIRDTGRGMDAAFIRDRLFRPFDSTKGTEGMGIGAYQVRETVRACGGRLEVESEPGKGSHFTFVMKREV